jgi:hypothetical protein
MFPDWNSFVERLIAKDIGDEKAHELASRLLSKYSPDALIQAAHDRFGCDANEFIKILSDELYRDVRSQLNSREWDLFTLMLSARLGERRRSQWSSYLQLVQNHFPSLSAIKIAEVISDALGTNAAPTAIMSFNAEPLLASLISALIRTNQLTAHDAGASLGKQFDLITHSVSTRHSQHIPYYFIHGLLPIPANVKKRHIIDSIDKLVFSESEYLQIANNTFSWQSSVFLELASTQSVVFIGVSLSDPNMRRWLSWIHMNRIKEISNRYPFHGSSTPHYWITKQPETAYERSWIESSVEHLGVRLIWLNQWDQVGDALYAILGLRPSAA